MQTIIFLHIGRTAGTTLNHVLDRAYPRQSIYSFDSHRLDESIAEFRRLPEERRRALRVVRGHVSFGIHEPLPGPWTYITLLRDPVARIVSHYHYVLERPHRLHQRVVDDRMTLEEYVRSGISVELNDWQTRVLAGDETTAFGGTGRPLLERALENIEKHFAVVGLSERFDETVVLLQQSFGWKRPRYAALNATRARPPAATLSASALEAIRELNGLDIELYERGRSRFAESISRDPQFAARLGELERRNRSYARFAGLDRAYARGRNLGRRLRIGD